MTPRQMRFVSEYQVDLHATKAAIRAGYAPASAHVTACELLKNPKIQEAILAAQKAAEARTGITSDRVLQELAIIAFADLSDYVQWGPDGVHLLDSSELDAAKRRAIVEVVETAPGGRRVRLADKKGALELLGKHLGLFVEKIDATSRVVVVDRRAAGGE